jgi:hypothetical protein
MTLRLDYGAVSPGAAGGRTAPMFIWTLHRSFRCCAD